MVGQPGYVKGLKVAMARPTDSAKSSFQIAFMSADQATHDYFAAQNAGDVELAKAVRHLADGLNHLSVGLRATYMLLEDIKRSLPPK